MDIKKFRLILESRTSINSETGCWEYLGVNGDGYGQVTIDREFHYVHVLSARMFLGYIPTRGLMVCHRLECKSKACWNPKHIYVGDAWENNQDIRQAGNARGRYSGVTHCVNGHELTSSNTYWSKRDTGQRRQCRMCRRKNDVKRKQLIKLAKLA